MQVNVHQAKTQLSKLIEAALRGEEVIIARDGKPAVRIEPLEQPKKKFVFGVLPGLVGTKAPEFFGPGSEDDLKDWE